MLLYLGDSASMLHGGWRPVLENEFTGWKVANTRHASATCTHNPSELACVNGSLHGSQIAHLDIASKCLSPGHR